MFSEIHSVFGGVGLGDVMHLLNARENRNTNGIFARDIVLRACSVIHTPSFYAFQGHHEFQIILVIQDADKCWLLWGS